MVCFTTRPRKARELALLQVHLPHVPEHILLTRRLLIGTQTGKLESAVTGLSTGPTVQVPKRKLFTVTLTHNYNVH